MKTERANKLFDEYAPNGLMTRESFLALVNQWINVSNDDIINECRNSGLISSDHLWQGFVEGAKWMRDKI